MKKVILILLMFFPIVINGKCDNLIREEGKKYTENIETEIVYNKSNQSFSFVIYNLVDKMSVVYNKRVYKPEDKKVVINNLKGGTRMTISFYYEDGCDSPVQILKKQLPYYNEYYNSDLCRNYKDILYVCTSKFTTYNVTEDIVELAIKNYDSKRIPIEKNPEIIEEEPSIFKKTKSFIDDWGLQIALVLSSSLITYVICVNLYRKEVHGV